MQEKPHEIAEDPHMAGTVEAIYIAEAAKEHMRSLEQAVAVPGKGLEGDRYFRELGAFSNKPGPGREVTLIELEAIEALRREHHIVLEPGESRRNIMTRGISINEFVGQTFGVGEVTLLGIRLCEPCSYLEELTRKKGVLCGLVHRGGLRAQILSGGTIRLGDRIDPVNTACR